MTMNLPCAPAIAKAQVRGARLPRIKVVCCFSTSIPGRFGLRLPKFHKAKGVVHGRVRVEPLVSMDAQCGNTDPCALSDVSPTGEIDSLGGHNLSAEALDEHGMNSQALTDGAVHYVHLVKGFDAVPSIFSFQKCL